MGTMNAAGLPGAEIDQASQVSPMDLNRLGVRSADFEFPWLLPQHRRQLQESAIAPAIALQRGYASVTQPEELLRLGFARYQCKTPGMLLPGWTVRGDPGTPQFRPDLPRIDARGRPVEYETPAGAFLHVDVPPAVYPRIGDPGRPLGITEGVKKADSAVSHGLDCMALAGVWNWRGRNSFGRLVALPDWELVALNGRAVYLLFDSDVMQKRPVYEALRRLRSFLRRRGADVRVVYLPEDHS